MADFIQQQAACRVGTVQALTYTGTTSASSTAFGAQTRQIRVTADSACHYLISDGTVASTTAAPFLPANVFEYVTVTPGQKISAIQAATNGLVTATAGTIWVTELS